MARKPETAAKGGTHEEYLPTASEANALEAFQALNQKRPPAPRLKVEKTAGEPLQMGADHPDHALGHVLIMSAIGTADFEFYDGFLKQLINAGTQGKDPDTKGINFMLSVVKGIEPRDQLEAMLAAQMAAVHMASMTFARRLAHVDNITQQDSAERAFNKLTRTFATQLEALKRYRSKGEQKMTVEHQHVTVNQGGQAIVGNVTAPVGGGAPKKPEEQPHAKQLADAPGETLPGNVQAIREAMPLASS